MQQLVFITGSTGLIGGHLLVGLHKRNYKVRALIRKSSSFNQLQLICDFHGVSFEVLHDTVEWVEGDTLDFVGLHELMKDVAEVFHCAAMVSFNQKNSDELLRTNVQGTSNMVDAAIDCGVKRFCFISSIAALGSEKNNGFIDEFSFRDPHKITSSYTESKYLSELEVWRGSTEGLDVVILNPGVVLGPGNPDKGSLLFFKVAKKGMPFYTEATTGYVDVRDIARAAIELMTRGIFGKRFVLVSENIDNKRLFTLIANGFGKRGPVFLAGKTILYFGAFISNIVGLLSGTTPQLTRDTVRSAQHPQRFTSKQIKEVLNFEFIPIEQTVIDTVGFMKKHNL